ncbi:MAG: GGDEF domain-containing protein [Gordonibacter pamelaeae]
MDLSKRAQHDGLTGLLNWATFRERAEQQLETGTGALLVIDTDDFKSVNDTYGHLAGDAALRQTATVLRNAFRSHDLIGRLGGDEFAVCICGSIEHSQLVERCSLLVEQGVEFSDEDGIKRLITLSIGGIGDIRHSPVVPRCLPASRQHPLPRQSRRQGPLRAGEGKGRPEPD